MSLTLSVGVIVQFTKPLTLYVMSERGGIDALEARTGRLLWHSDTAAAPLLARDTTLVAVAPPRVGETAGQLFTLDTRSGRVIAQLPDLKIEGWRVVLEEDLRTSLELYGVARGDRNFVVWAGHAHPMRGGVLQPAEGGKTVRGAVEVDLVNGRLVPTLEPFPDIDLEQHADRRGGIRWDSFDARGVRVTLAKIVRGHSYVIFLHRTRGPDTLPGVVLSSSPSIFRDPAAAVDRQHVVVAYYRQDKTGPAKDKYDVTVFDAATGQTLGHLLTDAWPARFLIADSVLVYYVASVVRVVAFPSGRTLLERTVRDLTYRGPYPPAAPRP